MPDKIPPEYVDVRKTEIRWTSAVRITQFLATAGAVCFLGYCFWQATAVMAGHETTLNLVLRVLSDLKLTIGINIAATASFTGLWLRERKLRKDTVERLQSRIKKLELARDPQRTTSNLDARGDTNPEDKI
ncbi:MAG: hypothetical protein IH621_18405 [Krumholzibacteria bacterium]|nr:hypothetical protein [Candidatus Krumholzibacteria bacterium]